jgi:hypothetical protein
MLALENLRQLAVAAMRASMREAGREQMDEADVAAAHAVVETALAAQTHRLDLPRSADLRHPLAAGTRIRISESACDRGDEDEVRVCLPGDVGTIVGVAHHAGQGWTYTVAFPAEPGCFPARGCVIHLDAGDGYHFAVEG